MFEELITQLDPMGVQYTEDYDAGTLTIDVSVMDKVTLIPVIQLVADSALDFTIDESSLTVMGAAEAMVEPMVEEEVPTDLGGMQDDALGQLF